MKITKKEFGITDDNQAFSLYTIENTSGASVTVSDYGCRLIRLEVPDKKGVLTDVSLGYNDASAYAHDQTSLGAVVGRCANRIAKGRFTLNGNEYQLALNNGPNHLHGGSGGFGQRVFLAKISDDKVIFSRTSPDGEEGYPGNLQLSVTYGWSEDNELSITYEATCDTDTVFSVTSHGYFNLDGVNAENALDHELRIYSDSITAVDSTMAANGKILPVEGTPFDFREMKRIGQDIMADDQQLSLTGTYDQNFIINGDGLREAAVLQSRKSGIRMTCFTDQPGLQVYVPTGALSFPGKNGNDYPAFSSVCLETQQFPNAVNIPEFPSVILKAGEIYRSKTLYHFSII
ncbi:MAG: galactose mutarotase [Lachnospiraceae bacterium]|nr:galactose mutarotase [Lachnospiraceae bacterium]